MLEQHREMLREQSKQFKADKAEQRELARADRVEIEQKIKADRAEMEAKLEAKIAELTVPAPAAISAEQLVVLQDRLEGMHTTKLLTDEVRVLC